MANYEIPFVAPDASQALTNLSNVFQKNRAAKQTDEELRLRGEKLKNDERRLNNEEYRRKREFEQSQQDRRDKAFLSALEFEKKGDYSTADAIRRAHGIESTPEMSAPTPYTPAMALEASRKAGFQPEKPTGNPVALEQSDTRGPATPLNAFSRAGEHAGVSVPEMQPEQQPAVPPPDVTIEPPTTGRAVEDLMPMTEDPHPTGAKRFTGPDGAFLGRFDPEEERRFRAERAGRVSEALGPMGDKFTKIAELVAKGDITEAQGKVLMTTLASEENLREKQNRIDARQEDQQAFTAIRDKLYRNEPLTVQDRYNLARIAASAKVSASGGGPITPAEAALVGLAEQGAGLGEITAQASVAGPAVDMKHLTPLVQNVVKNAATAERAGDKRSALGVNDLYGNYLGEAHNQTQANKMKAQTDQFAQARTRLRELIEDIKKDGSRVNPLSVEEIQDRLSKAESVNAAMRVYNGLGATDASQQLEARITGAIGTPGHGWIMGANLGVIERILHEAEMQHDARLKTTLRSGPSARPLAPSLGGPRREEGGESKENRKRALMDRLGL